MAGDDNGKTKTRRKLWGLSRYTAVGGFVLVLVLLYVSMNGEEALISRETSSKLRDGVMPVEDEDALLEDGEEMGTINVCLRSNNPRTASLFTSGFFRYRGKGVFHYVSAKQEPCDPAWPVIDLRFQRSLPGSFEDLRTQKETVVVQGDEYCRCPLMYCGDKTIVPVRQYYNARYDVDSLKRVDERKDSENGEASMYLPLGPRIEFAQLAPINPSEIVHASKRKYLVNLIASPTNPSRQYLAKLLGRQDIHKRLGGEDRLFVHITPRWSRKDAEEAKGFVKPGDYRRILMDSTFTLCPLGHNPEAFRIFEACEVGSIPIFALDDMYINHSCEDAFAPLLRTGAPFVVLETWNQLPQKLEELRGRPEELDRMQTELQNWNQRFWKDTTTRFECLVLKRHGNMDVYAERCKFEPSWRFGAITFRDQDPLPSPNYPNERFIATPVTHETDLRNQPNGVPLITGCGRSGTLSLQEYLVSIGIPAVHENMKQNHVSVSWLYAARDSRYPFESQSSARLRIAKQSMQRLGHNIFHPVVHLVRHPLKVISSTRRCFCGRGDRTRLLGRRSDHKSWLFVQRHLHDIPPKEVLAYDSIERSARYWLGWNMLIDANFQTIQTVLRLEDLNPIDLLKGLDMVGKNTSALPEKIPSAPHHVSPGKEKLKRADVTWKDVYETNATLAKQIFQLAQRYGYESETTFQQAITS